MSVQEKLQKGRDRLNKAGNDPDLLGLALTSIHGALEDTCRNWLSAPAIKQQHGVDVQNKAEANWQNILELMSRYCGWSERDVKYVRRMNALRNQAAHGDGFEGTRQNIEQYLSYVEKAIAKGGTFSSSSSKTNSSFTGQYFSNNIAQGGKVTSFRFRIERSNKGVKISNRRGSQIISANANSNYNWGCLQSIGIYFAILIGCSFLSSIPLISTLMAIIVGIFLIIFPFVAIWQVLKNSFFSATSVFLASDRIYIGKKSYPIPGGTYFRFISQTVPHLFKFYVVQPNKVVYFAHNLTWHEADELLKIAINSIYMIQDSRSQFTISLKDGLIFINSCKTQMSFVLEHNDRLWESLRCRMLENNLVELTKSELKELYSRKLQAF